MSVKSFCSIAIVVYLNALVSSTLSPSQITALVGCRGAALANREYLNLCANNYLGKFRLCACV